MTATPLLAKASPVTSGALVFAGGHSIAFTHLHTGEKMNLAFGEKIDVTSHLESQFSRFLRDHYSGDVTAMDPALIRHLLSLQQHLGIRHSHFQVISGYRSPRTNAMLRRKGSGVARRSLHMLGQAIDIRLDGARLSDVRAAAIDLKAGGVGFYPKSNFVHLDTGRVRNW